MKEHPIDEIFKSGAGEKGIAYNEAYWTDLAGKLPVTKVSIFYKFKNMLALVGAVFIASVIIIGVSNQNSNTSITSEIHSDKTIPDNYLSANDIDAKGQSVVVEEPVNSIIETDSDLPTLSGVDLENVSEVKLPLGDDVVETAQTPNPLQLKEPKIVKKGKPMASIPVVEVVAKTYADRLASASLNSIPSSLNVDLVEFKLNPAFKGPEIKNGSVIPNKFKPWEIYGGINFGLVDYTRDKPLMASGLEGSDVESTSFSYSFGFGFKAQRGNVYFKSGLNILSLNEITNYVTEDVMVNTDTSYRVLSRDYGTTSTGNRVILIEQVVDTLEKWAECEVKCPDCQAQFRYVSIPISVGYELTKSNWSVFGDLGINSAIRQNVSGLYSINLDQGNEVYSDLNKTNTAPVLFAFTGNIGIEYQVIDWMSINASYGYQKGLNSMMTNYNQKSSLSSVSLGLSFKFK